MSAWLIRRYLHLLNTEAPATVILTAWVLIMVGPILVVIPILTLTFDLIVGTVSGIWRTIKYVVRGAAARRQARLNARRAAAAKQQELARKRLEEAKAKLTKVVIVPPSLEERESQIHAEYQRRLKLFDNSHLSDEDKVALKNEAAENYRNQLLKLL